MRYFLLFVVGIVLYFLFRKKESVNKEALFQDFIDRLATCQMGNVAGKVYTLETGKLKLYACNGPIGLAVMITRDGVMTPPTELTVEEIEALSTEVVTQWSV